MSYQLSFIETYERTPTSGVGAGVPEKGVILRNSNFVRRFGDSDWNRIRVAVRHRFMGSGSIITNLTSQPAESFFGVGFCHGTTNVLGSQTIDNVAGGCKNAMVYTWSTLGYYFATNQFATYSGSSSSPVQRRVQGSTTSNWRQYATTSSLYPIFFDLERTANPLVWNTQLWYPRNTTDNFHITNTDFLNNLILLTPSLTGMVVGTNTMVIDESTHGELNSVNVYWNYYEPCVEIVDLYVVRLA